MVFVDYAHDEYIRGIVTALDNDFVTLRVKSVGDIDKDKLTEDAEEPYDIGESEGLAVQKIPKEFRDRVYNFHPGDLVRDLSESTSTVFFRAEEAPIGASELKDTKNYPYTPGDTPTDKPESVEESAPEVDSSEDEILKAASIRGIPAASDVYIPKGYKVPAWYIDLYHYLDNGSLGASGVGTTFKAPSGHMQKGYSAAKDLKGERSELVDHAKDVAERLWELERIIEKQEEELATAKKAPRKPGLKIDLSEFEERLEKTKSYIRIVTKELKDANKAIDEVSGKLTGPHPNEARRVRERLEKEEDPEKRKLLEERLDKALKEQEHWKDRAGPMQTVPADVMPGTGTAFEHTGLQGTSVDIATGKKGIINEIKTLSGNYKDTKSLIKYIKRQQGIINESDKEVALLLDYAGVYPKYKRHERGGRLYKEVDLKTLRSPNPSAQKVAKEQFKNLKKEQFKENIYVPTVTELQQVADNPGALFGKAPWIERDYGPPTIDQDIAVWAEHISKKIRNKMGDTPEKKILKEIKEAVKAFKKDWDSYDSEKDADQKDARQRAIDNLPVEFRSGSALHPSPGEEATHDPSAFLAAEDLYTELQHPKEEVIGITPPTIAQPLERWLHYLREVVIIARVNKDNAKKLIENFKEVWAASLESSKKSGDSTEDSNRAAAKKALSGLPAYLQEGFKPQPPAGPRPFYYFTPEEINLISDIKVTHETGLRGSDLFMGNVPTLMGEATKEKAAEQLAEEYTNTLFGKINTRGALAKKIEWLVANQEGRKDALAKAKEMLKPMLVQRDPSLEKALKVVDRNVEALVPTITGANIRFRSTKAEDVKKALAEIDFSVAIERLKKIGEALDHALELNPSEVMIFLNRDTLVGIKELVDKSLEQFEKKEVEAAVSTVGALLIAYKHIIKRQPIMTDHAYMEALHNIFNKYAIRTHYDEEETFFKSFGGAKAIKAQDALDVAEKRSDELKSQIANLSAKRDNLLEPVQRLEESFRASLRMPDVEEAQEAASRLETVTESLRWLKDQRWTRLKLRERGERVDVAVSKFDEEINRLSEERSKLLKVTPEQTKDAQRLSEALKEAENNYREDGPALVKEIDNLLEISDKLDEEISELRSKLGEE